MVNNEVGIYGLSVSGCKVICSFIFGGEGEFKKK